MANEIIEQVKSILYKVRRDKSNYFRVSIYAKEIDALYQQATSKNIAKYRKKPIVIEAIQWNKPDESGKVKLARECNDHPMVRPTSYKEVVELCGTCGCSKEYPYWDWSVMGVIDTLEGKHVVSPGDYIIQGVSGEYYPCKPDIFEKTYEKVEE